MSTATKPQENPMRNEPGAPHDRGPATVSSPGSRQQQSRGRKRSHPSDAMDDGAPPNVKLPTAIMQQQKQMLYKRVAEAERNPFFLHPHQVTPIYPFLPLTPSVAGSPAANNSLGSAGKFSPGVYPLVQQSPPNLGLTMVNPGSSILTPPSSVSTSATLTTQANSATTNVIVASSQPQSAAGRGGGGSGSTVFTTLGMPATPPRAQFYGPFVKCPVSPPTPSGIATLSVLSPWNIAAMSQIGIPSPPTAPVISSSSPKTNASKKSSDNPTPSSSSSHSNMSSGGGNWNTSAVSVGASTAPILPQHILSPRPGFTSIQSPLSYLHASPLSPMMLIQSPYASSVSSCPSVSSSSGCSSDGGASFTTGLQVKNYAPSEYHVGPRRPLSEKLTEEDIVSEGANSSGRNTPVDAMDGEDDRDTDTPHQNVSVFASSASQGRAATGGGGSGDNVVPTFTQFAITSQGPSIVQPSTPRSLNAQSSSSTSVRHLVSTTQPHAIVVDLTKSNSSGGLIHQTVSGHVGGSVDPVAYPYSVDSGTHSMHPMSEESTSHGYVSSVLQSSSGERPSSGVSSMSSSLSSRESTPDPEEVEPLPSITGPALSQDPSSHLSAGLGGAIVGGATRPHPHHAPQGSDTFCLVPGRLSLLSSTQKYKVTVDEVRRRLSHPECLNASVLGGILRRAKSKNGGHVLRQRLDSIGLSLPPGRRKATELSLLTSLVEGEATHLSSDFRRICETYFPHVELAQIIARQHVGTPQAQHRVSMVKAAQLVISELQAMLNAVGGPSNIKANDPNNPYPGLTNFSLLTHGFGNPAINTSLTVVQTYLQELLAFYDGRKPIQPENRFSTFGGDKVHHAGQFVNGLPHPVYAAGPMAVPNSDTHSTHHSHSSTTMKQEPISSPRHTTL